MVNLKRKALPIVFVLVALALVAWTSAPALAQTPTVEPNATSTQSSGGGSSQQTPVLTGSLGSLPDVQQKIQEISSFKPNLTALKRDRAKVDEEFITDGITTNTEELAIMQYAVTRVTNPDLKDLIQFMIEQHTEDQTQLVQIYSAMHKGATNKGTATPSSTGTPSSMGTPVSSDTATPGSTSTSSSSGSVPLTSVNVDLSHSSVFPNTGDYDLGVRVEDMNAKYLARLQAFSGTGKAFDQAALDILMEIHGEDIQGEVVAQTLIHNVAMKNFAANSAEVTALHITLMDALNDQEYVGLQPSVDFGTRSILQYSRVGKATSKLESTSTGGSSGTATPSSTSSGH